MIRPINRDDIRQLTIDSDIQNAQPGERLNVLLVGGESAGIQTLRTLAASPHHVVAVAASPSSNSKAATLWNAADRMGFERCPANLVKQSQFSEQVRTHQVDLILNVHSLFIMHADVIDACRIGAFNMHPGPLPEYAGLNVPSWAIYHGETEHAVTIHQMVPQIDAGTIAYQQRFPIEPDDTGMSLMLKCIRAGVPLIKQLLDDAAQGAHQIPRIEQDFSRRRYLYGAAPNDGKLCWHRSARDVVNHVRASDYSPFDSPWGHPVISLDGRQWGVVRARQTSELSDAEPGTVGRQHDRGVDVATADEWVFVETLTSDGQPLDAAEVLRTGCRLEERTGRRCEQDVECFDPFGGNLDELET